MELVIGDMMYYNDVLLCYHVTPEEISKAYRKKHNYDRKQDFIKEYEEQYNG